MRDQESWGMEGTVHCVSSPMGRRMIGVWMRWCSLVQNEPALV